MAPFLTRIVSSFKMGKFRNKNSKIKSGPNFHNKPSLFGESVWKWVALGRLHADVVHRNLARRIVRNPLALCYVYMKPTIETKETSFWMFSTLLNHLLWKQRRHRKETIYSGLLDQQNSSHWHGAAPGPFVSSFHHKTSTRHWHQRCNDGWRLSCDHHTWVTIDGPLDATVNRNAETAQATY